MNEKADKAAKEAANSTILYHSTNLPLDFLLVHLKQKIKHHWIHEWKALVKPQPLTIKNIFYKNVVPLTLKRRNQVVMSRIIIGDTKITHKYILTKENQSLCERCRTTLTIDHLILQCEVYLLLRKQLRVKTALKDNLIDSATSSSLIHYLKHTKIYNNI